MRPMLYSGPGRRAVLSIILSSVCPVSSGELHQRVKHKIDPEKCLASILWSVNGILSLLGALKGTVSNTALFTDAIMCSLIEMFSHGLVGRRRKMDWSTWTKCVVTIRGEFKGASRPE
jgi:hypothetical protein